MKYCPKCQTGYADDSLQFCLEDGTNLLYQTSEDWEVPTQVLSEVQTVVKPNRITNDWEQSQVTRLAVAPNIAPPAAPFKAIMTIAIAVCLLFICSIGGWLFLSGIGSGGRDSAKNYNQGKDSEFPNITPTLTPRINRTPPVNQETTPTQTVWLPVNNQASLNGERLTYYRGTTVEQCRSDCDQNPKCRAFTLIRAGAYNPDDPPMCYLMSEVTEVVSHSCCISAIKR